MASLLFVGLDVDDKKFHGCVISKEDSKEFQFSCKPVLTDLCKKLEKISKNKNSFKICYEAGYLGYSLERDLRKQGYECEIIAPSLIPKIAGRMIKTDRIDARNLAWMYKKGLLTLIHVPRVDEEQVRDLIRTRQFITIKLKSIKNHILSLCRRMNIDFKKETEFKCYWTQAHVKWLKNKINDFNNIFKFNLTTLFEEYEHLIKLIEKYEKEIVLISHDEKYFEKVEALICYRGFDVLCAMNIICEIGDIKRFAHPRKLASYCGFDIREYSSGGKEYKFGITKAGNSLLRKHLIESCQKAIMKPAIESDHDISGPHNHIISGLT